MNAPQPVNFNSNLILRGHIEQLMDPSAPYAGRVSVGASGGLIYKLFSDTWAFTKPVNLYDEGDMARATTYIEGFRHLQSKARVLAEAHDFKLVSKGDKDAIISYDGNLISSGLGDLVIASRRRVDKFLLMVDSHHADLAERAEELLALRQTLVLAK